jgi:hypothetical protein
MKKTQKYSKACQLLTFSHDSQEQLYAELNRLGWYWQPVKKEWERDDTPAKEATKLIKVRVWADATKVENAVDLFTENVETMGLKLLERSNPYPCRPPNQKESRIYLTFEDVEQ